MTSNKLSIRKAAVLGAGVMGAQIAAHLTNAGIQTVLFDLASEGDLNTIAKSAQKALTQLKPLPLGEVGLESLITPANYSMDLTQLCTCDLIIEAIAEQFDFKQKLYQKIIPYVAPTTIIATNTSGLGINRLAAIFPDELRKRFLGIHFFNPPRYMRLIEMIPQAQTDKGLLEQLESFLTTRLGKGIVFAKDTPNFIANRIGVFSLLSTLYHAQALKISPDRVDNLTGPLIGRAKSATFRTMDIVGLDTLRHVINTLKTNLPDDPYAFLFTTPAWIEDLITKGALGQKAKKGIYKKEGEQILVWDEHDKVYRQMHTHLDQTLLNILYEKNTQKRFEKIMQTNTPELDFIWRIHRDLFHYCALHLDAIADSTQDIDLCMRWGYGWQRGPFEIWQLGNFPEITQKIQQDIDSGQALVKTPLPAWVNEDNLPYKQGKAYSPDKKQYIQKDKPVYRRQYIRDNLVTAEADEGKTLLETQAIRLWTLADNIPILTFKTPRAIISMDVLAGIQEAIARCEKDHNALVIWQKEADFTLGANLKEVIDFTLRNEIQLGEKFVREFQKTAMMLRYAQIPTVVALSGLTLGGGCELSLHATKRVAAFETYIGLVEVGVGLIPAGGGSKELALKASQADGFNTLKKYFEQVAMAQTSSSALDAKRLGYLKESDVIVYHTDELLFMAKKQAQALADESYFPPLPRPFKVSGKTGIANLQTYLINLHQGDFISKHDYEIGTQLAHVMCGGAVEAGSEVTEDWILGLEREAIISLIQSPLTMERIVYTLEKGKMLRN